MVDECYSEPVGKYFWTCDLCGRLYPKHGKCPCKDLTPRWDEDKKEWVTLDKSET